ncbi:MAG: hypothetical protein AMJ58_10295 [Gammaproteobacteria bacterium SG8_30]|nr:MAG: hypothetical protein AMJ58_10295 [Gammaproteobacteria bacterium SG8_30]
MRDTKMIILAVGSTVIGLGLMVASVLDDESLVDRVKALATSTTPNISYQTVLERDLGLAPGGSLRLNVPDADIRVTTAPAGGRLSVEIRAEDATRARELFQRMQFTTTAEGNALVVRADDPHLDGNAWRGHGDVHVRIHVGIPNAVDLSLTTGDGDVSVGSVEGRVEIQTGDGDGDVSLGMIRASTLMVQTGDGDIAIGGIEAERIELRTGDGDVALASAAGPIDAATNDGDVSIQLATASPVSVRTGDGDIAIIVAQSLGFDLDLTGADVSVPHGMVMEGDVTSGSARGTVNGGGPLIKAVTGDGTVVVKVGER